MNRKNGELRREQLLEVALRLFSEQGFEGTSTRAIAEAAGVTEALIFHYFPTKLALFHAVIVEHGAHRLDAEPLDLPEEMPLPERLALVFSRVLNTLWHNRAAMRMLLRASLDHTVAHDDLRAFDKQSHAQLERLFKPSVASSQIRAERVDAAAAIISFAMRGFYFAALRSAPEDWEAARTGFIRDLISVIMPGLLPANDDK